METDGPSIPPEPRYIDCTVFFCRTVTLIVGLILLAFTIASVVNNETDNITTVESDKIVSLCAGIGGVVHFYLHVIHKAASRRCRCLTHVLCFKTSGMPIKKIIVRMEMTIYWATTTFLAGALTRNLAVPGDNPTLSMYQKAVFICIVVNVFFRTVLVNIALYRELLKTWIVHSGKVVKEKCCVIYTKEETMNIVDNECSTQF